jgi:hypothetical protein
MPDITVPDILPYLLAILGLLLLWQLHNMQVQTGRIKTVDSWDRAGIRLFLHVTPEDSHACLACREANGMAFLPVVVASHKFRPLAKTCTNPGGCRCLLIGLHGAWAEAELVQKELKELGGRLHLSRTKLSGLVEGAQAQPAGAMVDQISLTALEAVRAEGRNLDQAIEHYHFVIEHAANERDQAFLVPAYLRLADLLEQRARLDEALTLVDQFFSKQADMQPPHAPTDAQRSQMSLRKTRLMAALKQGGHVAG